jgi:hypothetical protein
LNAATATIKRQDDEHHALLDLHRGEPGPVLARPVADQQVAAQAGGQLVGHFARLVQVAQLEPHAGRAFKAVDARRVVHVHQGQRRVVFEMPRVEGAHHRHLLEPRHHAGRRDLAAGRDQRDACRLRARPDARASSPPSTMPNSPLHQP